MLCLNEEKGRGEMAFRWKKGTDEKKNGYKWEGKEMVRTKSGLWWTFAVRNTTQG